MGGCERESKRTAAVEMGKKVYARRKETVERSFADAKQHHGHRYARFRGLSKVQMQCLLAATAQNMKKMVLLCAFLVAIHREIRRRRGCKRGQESSGCLINKNIAIATFSRYKKRTPCKKHGVRQQSDQSLFV
ncbi:hypothetical protein DRC48_24485 [Salmonella enterica]|nr:hypothetical protein [Salmonella enterica]ECC9711311.1 hypothetical protein [Salmonella enterica subsp. enterica]